MTLFEKSMELLELPGVLKMLVEEAYSDGAKESAMELKPS